MTFRQEHPILFSFSSVVCICITIIVVIYTMGAFSIKATEIQEREQTERTEERSQFWQKVIPWGKYEEEN